MKNSYPEPRFCGYVGMPRALNLEIFATHVENMFNANVYLVGSALITKDWHDLDVVVVLSDSQWHDFGFGDPKNRFKNKKWISFCLVISNFGKKLIDCEIDFQITNESYDVIHVNDGKLKIGSV